MEIPTWINSNNLITNYKLKIINLILELIARQMSTNNCNIIIHNIIINGRIYILEFVHDCVENLVRYLNVEDRRIYNAFFYIFTIFWF